MSKKNPLLFALKRGLQPSQARILTHLKDPSEVQDFVTHIPANYEDGAETCLPVAEVLTQNRAHCIEGAFVAAFALWMQGRPPLLLDLKARDGDTDHVVALFQERGLWGAVSKSNHLWLRWRDPVFRNLRELALSYFHEYTSDGKMKTLWSYSSAFDLRRTKISEWVVGPDSCWDVAIKLDDSRHFPLLDRKQVDYLKNRDAIEVKGHQLIEYPRKLRKN